MQTSLPNSAPQQDFLAPFVEETSVRFAGFWLRFAAVIIDLFILIVVNLALGSIENLPSFTIYEWTESFNYTLGIDAEWVFNFLYYTIFESSNWQGTLGKRVLGLKVTDLEGKRISFLRAIGRHFAQYLSAITLAIGYMMAGWTEKKQALHDMIASTLVVQD